MCVQKVESIRPGPTRPGPARPAISATRLPALKMADFGPPVLALFRAGGDSREGGEMRGGRAEEGREGVRRLGGRKGGEGYTLIVTARVTDGALNRESIGTRSLRGNSGSRISLAKGNSGQSLPKGILPMLALWVRAISGLS